MIQIPENLKTNPVGKYLNMKPTKDKETLAMAMTKRKTSTHFQQFKNKLKILKSQSLFNNSWRGQIHKTISDFTYATDYRYIYFGAI